MHRNYFLDIMLLDTHNYDKSEQKTGKQDKKMMVILIIMRTKYFFKLEKVVQRPLQFKLINWFSSTDSVRNWAEGGGTSCFIYFR